MATGFKAIIDSTQKQIEAIQVRLQVMQKHLENPKPALKSIMEEFSLMEATRFKNGGFAYEWGIYDHWKLTDPSTDQKRAAMGGNTKDQPLVNYGYLAAAATSPTVDNISNKSLALNIDPSKRAPQWYSHGHNYGAFHQNEKGNPNRRFVTITPQFREIAKVIIKWFVLSYDEQMANRHNEDWFTPQDTEAGKLARKHRGQIKRRVTNLEKSPPMDARKPRGGVPLKPFSAKALPKVNTRKRG